MTRDKNILPPIDDVPILDAASNNMKISLATGDSGKIYIFHESPFPEPVSWIEYNMDEYYMTFISEVGRLQPLGIAIPDKIAKTIGTQDHIIVTHLIDGKERGSVKIPLMRQKYDN
ncbi:hypothetical protein [Marinomonas aquiplantarum]|uniref:Uncharacterized protein n=1 Tax=Marinomonas aquiplantarum TaxID=491951 RepID=A0A366D055_9GAMM|nr:hypothetical protein [Marinomonas aquiplantarum]RBO83457.1 hypothetical protein DFP76_104276 [Marinomonas aquiplantarum]